MEMFKKNIIFIMEVGLSDFSDLKDVIRILKQFKVCHEILGSRFKRLSDISLGKKYPGKFHEKRKFMGIVDRILTATLIMKTALRTLLKLESYRV